MEHDFDVSHSHYQAEKYGGKIGPATWYLDMERSTMKLENLLTLKAKPE